MRVKFAGALHHVLDRGDRRELIFHSDSDSELFLATLEQACRRAGWRVHTYYVLMSNHDHSLSFPKLGAMVWERSAQFLKLCLAADTPSAMRSRYFVREKRRANLSVCLRPHHPREWLPREHCRGGARCDR